MLILLKNKYHGKLPVDGQGATCRDVIVYGENGK